MSKNYGKTILFILVNGNFTNGGFKNISIHDNSLNLLQYKEKYINCY